ncbi:hypothetical protein GCM10020255_016630 [Rhodococcus baikonurensis]
MRMQVAVELVKVHVPIMPCPSRAQPDWGNLKFFQASFDQLDATDPTLSGDRYKHGLGLRAAKTRWTASKCV